MVGQIKDDFYARGMVSIRGMTRVFKIVDSSAERRKIERANFYVGLKQLGTTLTKKDSEALMDYLDKNQDGMVDYEEFLVGVRVITDI